MPIVASAAAAGEGINFGSQYKTKIFYTAPSHIAREAWLTIDDDDVMRAQQV